MRCKMTDYKKLLKELFKKYDEELALALDGNIDVALQMKSKKFANKMQKMI